MSRFYVLPGVPVNSKTIGGSSTYSTAPFDYRLSSQTSGRGCRFCPRGCDPSLRCNLNRCRRTSTQEGFPQNSVLCDRQFQYYSSSEKMMADRVQEIQRLEEKQSRRRNKQGPFNRKTLWRH